MTTQVLLRDVSQEDLPVFFEQQRDPEAVQMADFQSRDHDAFYAHWAKILANPAVRVKTIVFQGHVAGNVGSFEHLGHRHVGYWLGKEFWGMGIASRALSEFLDHDEVRPLYARVAKHNVASIRVLEKCGFARAGEDKSTSNTGCQDIEEWIMKLGGGE